MPPSTESDSDLQPTIPDFEIESLARCLLPKIQAFYDTPEGRAAFEEWKRQKQNT